MIYSMAAGRPGGNTGPLFDVRKEGVRGGERCFQQRVWPFFVRCANFDGKMQISVDIGGGECHN